MQHFTPQQLKERLEQAGTPPVLLDVRELWEFQICSISDSTLLPMGQVGIQIDEFDLDVEYIVICHHGIRSRSVCLFLERQGFTNITNLTGGIESWAQDIDLDMPTY